MTALELDHVKYADWGKGVALGFNVIELQAAVRTSSTPSNFFKVAYVGEQDAIFSDFNDKIEELEAKVFSLPDMHSNLKRGFNMEIRQIIEKLEPKIKNKGFQEERECRVVFDSALPDEFRIADGNDLVPFIKVPIGTSLKEMKIGPSCKASQSDMNDFLRRRLGYEVTVSTSNISLR